MAGVSLTQRNGPVAVLAGYVLEKRNKRFELVFFFFVFLPFLGPLPRHMEVPRLGVKLEP